jgi:hypothetical protein
MKKQVRIESNTSAVPGRFVVVVFSGVSLRSGGKLGTPGGPWGIGAGIVIGGIAGSILGEGAVDLVCDDKKQTP